MSDHSTDNVTVNKILEPATYQFAADESYAAHTSIKDELGRSFD